MGTNDFADEIEYLKLPTMVLIVSLDPKKNLNAVS